MKKFSIICLSLFLPLFLTACGFHPMYGGGGTPESVAVAGLEQVGIAIIPDREGQILRNALIDRMYGSGMPSNPSYTLHVAPLEESKKELAITKSSEATRAQLLIHTHMILSDKNGTTLLERNVRAITSYNVLESEFATRVTENTARENAINDLARQIERNLSLYFNRQ